MNVHREEKLSGDEEPQGTDADAGILSQMAEDQLAEETIERYGSGHSELHGSPPPEEEHQRKLLNEDRQSTVTDLGATALKQDES